MGSENSALKRDAVDEPSFTLPSGVNIYSAILQHDKLASVFVYNRENEDNVNRAAKVFKYLLYYYYLHRHFWNFFLVEISRAIYGEKTHGLWNGSTKSKVELNS